MPITSPGGYCNEEGVSMDLAAFLILFPLVLGILFVVLIVIFVVRRRDKDRHN